MKMRVWFGSWLVILIFYCFPSMAGVSSQLDPFTDKDRVLILAPHPDDEGIATGGVIQQAVQAGAQVKVVILTNGENNELSFLVYKKRPVLRPTELLAMGAMRYNESLEATKILGLQPADLIALGYPDFGTMEIFTKYWGPVKRPFRSMLSRQRFVTYEGARSVGAPYVGESIQKDLREIIREFKPTKIFVSHAADVNRDHRALYLFTKVALWDLEGEIMAPAVYPYIVHVVGWPVPRGYHPGQTLEAPLDLVKSDIHWYTDPLQELEVTKKYEAVNKYVSQVKYAPKYLVTFVRNNELFGDYPDMPLVNQMTSTPVWQQAGVRADGASAKRTGNTELITAVAYARQGSNLLVRIILKHAIDKEMGVSVFLAGYKQDVPFADMPKLNLLIGLDGFHIKDRMKNVVLKDVQFVARDRELIFTMPLYVLGSPDRILSTVKTFLYDLTLDESAWRVLRIN